MRAGRRAVVKLEAYPLTHYGTLEGTVETVSRDSTVDQQRGCVFPVGIRLLRNKVLVDGRKAQLIAGMAATVKVVTGQHPVFDFLWTPVAEAAREAGRER